jgi:xanthosine utilization system XapX-like protein
MLLIFLGIGIMYIGLLWKAAIYVFMMLGLLAIMVSMGIYLWVGTLSLRAAQVTCPRCGKVTKILGKTDQCMFCKTTLTFDPAYAPDKRAQQQ